MVQRVGARVCLWLRRRLWIAALAVGLGLSALGVVSAGARSGAPHGAARPVLPLRVVMFETAPTKAKVGRPAAVALGRGVTAVRSHLAALAWARADAAIVRWGGGGTASDRALAAVLAGIVSTRAHVRAAALIDGAHGSARAQLRALARLRASRGYLRIRSRPAIFVALADRSLRGCATRDVCSAASGCSSSELRVGWARSRCRSPRPSGRR